MKKSGQPKDTGTQVDVLIKQAGALTKPKWRDFNCFVHECDKLVNFRRGLTGMPSGEIEDNVKWCCNLVAKCKAGFERFCACENLEDPDDDESALSQAYIAKRITVMVASFPNANPN